jgi:L-ascorbate metabolism protein UlaG (beta-lactamase superfamily)
VSNETADPARITWLGHSTVLVELDGMWLLTDPVFCDRAAHLRRTTPADAVLLHALDGILVSPLHHEYLDLPTLELLGRLTPHVVRRGAAGVASNGSSRSIPKLTPAFYRNNTRLC